LGFPEFVRSRTAGPLFVSGGQDAEAALGGLVKLVRRSTPGGATNLQHRFVTEMRRAGATPAEMDAILKFDPPPNKFWSKMPLAYLREAIDKLPRFQLDVG
jgi:hypothetical protein